MGMKRVGRKLLVASLGVASVSYGGCGSSSTGTDGPIDVARMEEAGPDRPDAGTDGPGDGQGDASDASDASVDRQFIGNLVAF
jgi:hypothetical protein